MNHSNRPLSPHLQIYKLPLTALVSITHRMTGAALVAGWIAIILSFVPISLGEASYAGMQQLLNYMLVKIVLVLFLFALFLHWCHGLRHLLMDVGKTLQKQTMDRFAWVEIGLSLLLTSIAAMFIWG